MTTTTAKEVTAEFMILFNKLHDDGEDDEEVEEPAPKKKAKKPSEATANVLGPDDAVAISLAASEYYLNKKAEWGAGEMIDGFADFSRLIYAKAKEFKAKYSELFDAAAIALAIRREI